MSAAQNNSCPDHNSPEPEDYENYGSPDYSSLEPEDYKNYGFTDYSSPEPEDYENYVFPDHSSSEPEDNENNSFSDHSSPEPEDYEVNGCSDHSSPKKVLIVGEPVCGKTSLWNCFQAVVMKRDFFKSPFLDIKQDNGNATCLDIIEAPCQPEYSAIRLEEYDDARAILFTFDLTEDRSLTSLEETWYPEVRQHNPRVPVFLIGIKWTDDGEVSVLPERAEALAGKIGAVKYFLCTSENVEMVVPELVKEVANAVVETMPDEAE